LPWNKTLKIGVPVKGGFGEFVRFEGELLPKGFCINVFEEVVADLPYKLPCSYLPFEDRIGESNGTIDELVYKVYLKVCMDSYLLHYACCHIFFFFYFSTITLLESCYKHYTPLLGS
jgi:hypothetical protein